MIEKIKSAVKIKFQHLGLSEEALNGAASLVSITVTEESQIAGIVDKMEPALKGIQSDVDRRVNVLNGEKTRLETDKLALEEKLKGITPSPTPPIVGEPDSKLAEQLKAMQETLVGLQNKQTQDKQRQEQSVISEAARKLMIKEGVDEGSCDVTLDLVSISEGETAETLAAKGVERFNSLQKHFTPGAGAPRTPDGSSVEDAQTEYFAKRQADIENERKMKENG